MLPFTLIVNLPPEPSGYLLSQKKSHTNFKLFNELLVTEKKFCEYQSQKVASITQLLQRNTDINHETNVLAYYIIRCEIFSRLPQFLKMCRENNKGYVHMKNQRIWFAFLKRIGNTKNNYKLSKSKLLSTTMKMSSIEQKVFTGEWIHHPCSGNEPSCTSGDWRR